MSSISDSHRRALAVSLRLIEKRLRSMEVELRHSGNPTKDAIMYRATYDIDDSKKSKMLPLISTMLDEIKQMKNDFGLEPDVERIRSSFSASLSQIWLFLEELRPGKLEAYGHLSSEERARIEPHILKLLKLRNEVEESLHSRTDGGRPGTKKS